jgi:hypothetical protein
MTEVWIEYWFYLPANFYHRKPTSCSSNAANQKFIRVWGPTEGSYGSNDPKAGASFDPIRDASGNYNGESKLYMQWGDKGALAGGTSNTMFAGQEAGSNWGPAFTRDGRGRSQQVGTWVRIRMHFKLASSLTASDGEIELWVDDVKVVSLTGRDWHGSAGNWLSSGYLMGWANSSYAQTTEFFIDDFRVFGSNPGW